MSSSQSSAKPDDRGFALLTEDHLLELGRIASGLVHEIKNPLGVIALNAELLREQAERMPEGPERERLLRRIARIAASIRELQAIITSFLQFAKPARPDPAAVDINRVLEQVIDEQAEANAAAQISVIFRPDEGIAAVPADPLQLAMVFRNILVNAREALRARPEHRRIIVATRALQGAVRVMIANNGPPLSERVAAHLFEPFVTDKEHGTGLGLAIVKRLVAMHHGVIHVASDKDSGVSFTIEFPTNLGPARARAELPSPLAPVTVGESGAAQPT
ncbi:MAG: HAMP domain-containing sensor histidine kinase [Planctomycetota bacterium]|nr:HAMP domain-containing histidine kinase [Planctomycetota bacterium]MCX8040706.1 HAMP domain-containing histidine kinase [Planctomycetota bacterium]MDW8373464.1 HAMP domain-containing sensor histidine kinase [Planctomycetota bacterium]